ncbi:phosphotransferase family protein [Nocardioides sp. URHA0032]|uniref:phosphotransferase family protein n=1 Tax=Nocardioides sp. URHA0032 TaxID=1380388 RepID=UPI00068540B4|nr:phosphotransferase [Nocardioides sp. URHA0032]
MTSPRVPTTIPHGRTARRLEWTHLPPHVRALVEERCGSAVVSARSQGAGFTPGFASVLTCEDGSRHFVKAASQKAQRMFAEAYREEARKLGALPDGAPAPRLLWTHDADDWMVLGIEYVESRQPGRPWRPEDLTRCVAMTEQLAAALTPPPDGLVADDFATEFDAWPAYWDALLAAPPDLPGFAGHAPEAASLAARFGEVTAGSTLVHTDIRDDNLLLAADGRVLLCDWNWPVVGAAWLDTVLLLIGPRGDGLDVDAVLAASPLLAEVPAEAVDIVIALVTAYFLVSARQPVPPTSPHMRDAQRWQGEVCWDWLRERRQWA